MKEFKIYKLSHGWKNFDDKQYSTYLSKNIACMSETTEKNQYTRFEKAEKGDVIFICHSSTSVDVIGMFKDERPFKDPADSEEWVNREYITLFEAKNNGDHDKTNSRGWKPSYNSTFFQVKENELKEFEEDILKPVFEISLSDLQAKRDAELKKIEFTISDIVDLQREMFDMSNGKKDIIDVLNGQTAIEKWKNLFEFEQRNEGGPVIKLRKKIAKYLDDKNNILTDEIIQTYKKEIAANYETNAFQAWKYNFSILYPFIYNQYVKEEIIKLMTMYIESFRKDLKIAENTKYKLVSFDGVRNFGSDELWFAIYHNSHKSQKTAKQLYFQVKNGFRYGLHYHVDESEDKLTTTTTFDYQKILEDFRTFIPIIMNDDNTKYKELQDLKELLEYKKQIILQGAPGTGKTYTAKDLAEYFITNKIDKENQPSFIRQSEQIEIIQFHPAYTYEDFIRGIVTEPVDGKIHYAVKDKLLLDFVKKAEADNKKPYILIIDEINRANLSAVLGELIYALEYRGESFNSMYAVDEKHAVSLPKNLYIIGTMNTADRSVGHIDYAIRRRFAFYDMLPRIVNDEHFEKELFETVSKLFVKEIKTDVRELKASDCLSMEFRDRPQDIWLGHSYFFNSSEDTDDETFSLRVKYEILPILQEYINDGILENTEEVKDIIDKIANYKPKTINGNS